jgi:hypothetical protein
VGVQLDCDRGIGADADRDELVAATPKHPFFMLLEEVHSG